MGWSKTNGWLIHVRVNWKNLFTLGKIWWGNSYTFLYKSKVNYFNFLTTSSGIVEQYPFKYQILVCLGSIKTFQS